MRQPAHEPNDPTRKGQSASECFCFRNKRHHYRIQAFHTRFDAVEWFVHDANSVIRQEASFRKAIEGLVAFTPDSPIADTEARIAALIAHLDDGTEADDISLHGDNRFEIGQREYLILTDAEATDQANENIAESLWAFRQSFLIGFMPDGCEAMEPLLSTFAEKEYEGANEAFRALIEAGAGLDRFKVAATEADGRGHFLSSYDGEENENDDASLFIYRTN